MVQFAVFRKCSALSLVLLSGLSSSDSYAQVPRPAVSAWRSYLPYSNVIDFETPDNKHFYCVSRSSFFIYDAEENITEAFSKANGMSDVDMSFVDHDAKTDKVVLTYANGNIDLFANGVFENIPDIKVSPISGDKTITGTYTHNGRLYLSSGVGLIVADLERKQISETVLFYSGNAQSQIRSVSGDDNSIVVATNTGLYRTTTSNPQFSNYSTWQQITQQEYDLVQQSGDRIYAAQDNDLYLVDGDTVDLIRSFRLPVQSIGFSADNNLLITSKDTGGHAPFALKLSYSGELIDSIPDVYGFRMIDEGDGYYWSCDGYAGLRRKSTSAPGEAWMNIAAEGPISNSVQRVWAKDGELWMAHGGKVYNAWQIGLNRDAFSRYRSGWRNWMWDLLALAPPDKQYSLTDAVDIIKDESSNEVYVALMNSGLLRVDIEEKIHIYQEGYLEANIGGEFGAYRLTSLALDDDDNLWMTQSLVQKPLRVKTKDNKWYAFGIPGVNHLAAVAIDDYGQKWMSSGNELNGGIVVYNDNGTLDDDSDDRSVVIRAGEATQLPSNAINAIAKDKNGTMWVGTEVGMVAFSCASDIRTSGACAATRKILTSKGFNFNSYLFEGIAVKSIAIDGGNRKWVGTNVGVFLMDEDTENILEYFTEQNSPLLSNLVKSVDIDPVTGTVFISTEKGLCSFGGSAVEAKSTMASSLKVYPNPVPSGYSGMISVKGVTEASNVKITDINGQLVYQAESNGGQLSWNGRDYTGRKVQSGVYLIYAVGKDGTQKATGKFIIHE